MTPNQIHSPIARSPLVRIWRQFLLVTCALGVSVTWATNFFVDATNGRDSQSGNSPTLAWQSLAKVNSSKFSPGDSILLKRGEIWREQLTIPSSGSSAAPCVYGSYGDGAKPVLSASVVAGGWTRHQGQIFVTNFDASQGKPSLLLVDGVVQDIAHYPNFPAPGYLLATATAPNTTTVIDSNLILSEAQIVGAQLFAKAVPWRICAATVTGFDANRHEISLDANVNGKGSTYVMRPGYGYFLSRKLWMLDSPGEWFLDSAAGKMYLWAPAGDDPARHAVEVSVRPYALASFGKSHLKIEGLELRNASLQNLFIADGEEVWATGLRLANGGGLSFYNTSHSTVSDNQISNSLSSGIQINGTVTAVEVAHNVVDHAGISGTTPKQSDACLMVRGTSLQIHDNTLSHCGYNGIFFDGTQIVIQNNHIDSTLISQDDGAGIYTTSANNTIDGNTVENSLGNFAGTPNAAWSLTQAEGIYLDDLSHDIQVTNNTVRNADIGIFIHTGHSNTISHNRVLKTRRNGILINNNSPGLSATAQSVYGNTVTSNIFETLAAANAYAAGTAYYYNNLDSNLTDFGRYDSNQYYHPNQDFAVVRQFHKTKFSDWQRQSGQDAHSTDSKSAYLPTVGIESAPRLGSPLSAPVALGRRRIRIDFTTTKAGPLRLEVFDLHGVTRKKLNFNFPSPGPQSVVWDASETDATPGLYVIRMTAEATFSRPAQLLP